MFRSRIAPTPSGFLHEGNAFNFVLTWLWTRANNGRLRLRIDDLDAPRARPEYVEDIFRTLEWLGLDWEDGPQTPDEHYQIYSQQRRIGRYQELLNDLIEKAPVFACTCSRKDILAVNPDGAYPGTCRYKGLPLDTPDAALRLLTPEGSVVAFDDVLLGRVVVDVSQATPDFIVRRRDGIPAYHIASLADDMDHDINHIVRGEDLLESTAAQLFLSQKINLTAFEAMQFRHHPLLKDGDTKLSKSAGSHSIKAMREAGDTPATYYQRFGNRMGWGGSVHSLEEALEAFARF